MHYLVDNFHEGKDVRTIILILAAAAIGLAILASKQAATIKVQQGQLAAANDRSKAESLGLQAQCAKQAKAAWDSAGFTDRDFASYQNHYNTRLNKCIVHLENRMVTAKGNTDNRTIFDAFENRDYGSYIWQSAENKGFNEVPPFICFVLSASGEKQKCNSSDEFDQLIKPYMEG